MSERDPTAGWVLAIDFGTSFSSAALATGEDVELVDLHGDRRVPSMVLLSEDGQLLVGVLAANQAAGAPDRLERTPKALVGRSPMLLLGGQPVPVVDVVAAVVRAFVDEARRRRGGVEPASVTLTHPVRWAAHRRRVLEQAAAAAGLDPERARLVEEPVAAASAFRSDRVRPSQLVAVYDLGGGTFDAAVLQVTESGFVVAGPPGGADDVGGEAFDERLLAHVGEQVAAVDADGWEELTFSEERRWRRAHAQLRDQVRLAKETLSIAEQASVYVPGLDRDVLVTRAEFERLIAADVERTLDLLDDVVAAAGTTPDQLAAVYPVGGSSRIPFVANQLLARYGDRVVTWDDPQAAVALGAARLARHHLRLLHDEQAAAAPPPPAEDPPAPSPAVEPDPPAPSPSTVEPVPLVPPATVDPEAPLTESRPRPAGRVRPDPSERRTRPTAGMAAVAPASGERSHTRRRRVSIVAITAALVLAGAAAVVALTRGGGGVEQDLPVLATTCPPAERDDINGTLDRACFARWLAEFERDVPPVVLDEQDDFDGYSDATKRFVAYFNRAFGVALPTCGEGSRTLASQPAAGHAAVVLAQVEQSDKAGECIQWVLGDGAPKIQDDHRAFAVADSGLGLLAEMIEGQDEYRYRVVDVVAGSAGDEPPFPDPWETGDGEAGGAKGTSGDSSTAGDDEQPGPRTEPGPRTDAVTRSEGEDAFAAYEEAYDDADADAVAALFTEDGVLLDNSCDELGTTRDEIRTEFQERFADEGGDADLRIGSTDYEQRDSGAAIVTAEYTMPDGDDGAVELWLVRDEEDIRIERLQFQSEGTFTETLQRAECIAYNVEQG